MVDSPPFREVGLEGSFGFPVLDEVLDESGKIRGSVVRGFG